MANPNAPYGVIPITSRNGVSIISDWNTIANPYGTDLGTGSLVQIQASGHHAHAGTGQFDGIVQGFRWQEADGRQKVSQFYEANTSAKSGTDIEMQFVKMFPNFVCKVRANGDIQKSAVGATYDMTNTAGVDTDVYGQSKEALNVSASGDQWRVIGLLDEEGNEWGEYAQVEVVPVNIVALSQTSI